MRIQNSILILCGRIDPATGETDYIQMNMSTIKILDPGHLGRTQMY